MQNRKRLKVINSFNMGILGGYVMVSAGFSYDELILKLKKNKTDSMWILALSGDRELINSSSWLALYREFENTKTGDVKRFFYIILKESFDWSDDSFCKLAHEVVHIIQFYTPHIFKRDNEIEFEAYLHTHIMSKCLSIFRGDKIIKNTYGN